MDGDGYRGKDTRPHTQGFLLGLWATVSKHKLNIFCSFPGNAAVSLNELKVDDALEKL